MRPALESPPAARSDARKVVTIVFADLAGSTALHERLDPESVRSFMEGYYRAMSAAVAAHGGTVVKLLGDGVMVAFGVPQVSEDDAIRAVRAGMHMQQAFGELAREHADIDLRIAINTGEVVVSVDNSDVLGDPVNVAARLQQEARGGDVVIGETTRRLVSTRVTLEPLGSVVLRGRAEQVRAWRVVSLERPTGVATAAFVGRDQEMGRIIAVFDAAAAQSVARLAVLLGSPGLGKSRLIGEVIQSLGENATVIAAQCDAAGGATFAPIAGALREYLGAGRDRQGEEVDGLQSIVEAAIPTSDGDRNRIASGIAALLAGAPSSPEETFFVVRRFLTGLATIRPVVLVIDDLHWAEPLLLDLVEHLVQWGSGVALLVLIGARPELRDLRSSLVTRGGLVSDVVTLGGLDAGAAMQLAANVIGASDLPAAVAAKVLSTTEGNPLFVGELVRMLVDEGALERHGDRWTIGANLAALEMPPTIQALLAARIERLRPEERAVLEHASVVGRQFSRGALSALLGRNGSELDARLEALRRSELIEPDSGWFLGEPVLRFHHVLIRDAAYRRLLKGKRADLHAQLAEWIEAKVGGAPEHDETVGRHLEQAHELLCELGQLDQKGRALGERAAGRLSTAGRRALVGDDVPLAANLLGRAIGRLDYDDPARAELALDWCEALLSAGDVVQTKTALAELGRFLAPPAAGSTTPEEASANRRLTAWHACFTGQLTVLTAPQGLEDAARSVSAAARELAAIGDSAGEAKAHFVHALALARLGEVGGCEAALDRALAAARGAGDRRRANTVLAIAPVAALWGPSPVTRASGRCLDVVRVLRITQGAPAVEAVALSCQGVLEALRGRTEAARRMIASAHAMVEELGITQRVLETEVSAGLVELLEGDAVAAERNLRGAYEGLRDLGLGIGAAQASALLARALLAQGRDAEAEALSHESELLAGDDLKAAIAWRGVRAEALARRGEHAAAVELASKAVELAAATDALLDHADARTALAAALRAARRAGDADAEARRATELWEAKGASLLAERARREPEPVTPTVRTATDTAATGSSVHRRVRPNVATATDSRIMAAFAAGDRDAMAAVVHDEYHELDHSTGSEWGGDAALASIERLLRSRDPRFENEALATLGERLGLIRRRTGSSGGTRGKWDVGPWEHEAVTVVEVAEDGRVRSREVFRADRVGAALAHLYERHAELLPDGPERARAAGIARSIRAYDGPADPDHLATALASSYRLVDHRVLSTWSARDAEEHVTHWRLQRDLVPDFAGRYEDVLALDDGALVARMTYFGTARESGGLFENRVCVLFRFGADGRVTSVELFEAEQELEALARFDEVTAASSPGAVRRRVRPNTVSATLSRVMSAFAAGDRDALATLVHDDYREVDHSTGSEWGRDAALASIERLLRSRDPRYHLEELATLGERLSLNRRRTCSSGDTRGRWDVGPYEHEVIQVVEVADDGRWHSNETFAADRLGDAIARLYETYGESQADETERARAKKIAYSVATWNGPTDLDHLRTAYAPEGCNVDHRVLSTWDAGDREEVIRHLRLQLELVPDFAGRYDDVIALDDRGLAARMTFFGTARDSGGAMENSVCALFLFGDDGRVSYSELFESEQTEEALARFVELTAGVPLASSAPPRSSVFNFAQQATERTAACWRARDWDGFAHAQAAGFRFEDRRSLSHLVLDADAYVLFARALGDMASARIHVEYLATRGEYLCLTRHLFAVAEGDVGPSDLEYSYVVEADDHGRVVCLVAFDSKDLDAAYAELDRRFEAVANLAQRAFDRAAACWRARDWESFASTMAANLRFEDRRSLSLVVLDKDGFVTFSRETGDMPSARLEVDHLATRGEYLCLVAVHLSVAGGDVGPSDLDYLYLYEVDEHGRTLFALTFDTKDLDVAYAELDRRFEDREGTAVAKDRRSAKSEFGGESFAGIVKHTLVTADALSSYFANAATRFNARLEQAWAVRDREAIAALHSQTRDVDDRRRLLRLRIEDDRIPAWVTAWLEIPDGRITVTPIATRGEHLALAGVCLQGNFDEEGGDFAIDFFSVAETDRDGRNTAIVLFDPQDVDAAYAELVRRFDTGDGAALNGFVGRWADGIARRDWEALIEMCSPDLVEHDHRPLTSVGTTSGRETFVLNNVRSWIDLAPDTVFRCAHVRTSDRAMIVQFSWEGTRDGGRYELPLLLVSEHDDQGRCSRVDVYDPATQFAAARTRFEELGAGGGAKPAIRQKAVSAVANFAQQATERMVACWRARDWDGFGRDPVAGFRFEDRRSLSLQVLDVDAYVRFARALGDMASARVHVEHLATRGAHLCLMRHRFEVADGDVGPSELEYFYLMEANDDGRAVCLVAFDSKDLNAAYAELDRRFAAIANVAQRTFERAAACWRARDWEGFASTMAAHFRFEDRRSFSLVVLDKNGFVTFSRELGDMPSARIEIDHLAARGDDLCLAAVRIWVAGGDVGPSELEHLYVSEVDEHGRSVSALAFDKRDLDAAYAELNRRFEGRKRDDVAKSLLSARSKTGRESFAPIVKRNLATANTERMWAIFDTLSSDPAPSELETARVLLAPGFVWEDRRPIVGLSGGLELFLASAHARLASGARHERRAIVGTAGDRVSITRVLWVGGPPDGRFEVEYLVVGEVNEAGLATAVIFIDPDDWRAAQREAWKRWVAIDPAAEEVTNSLSNSLDAWHGRDVDRLRDCFAEGLVVEDRRRTGAGRLDGREAYLRSLMVLFELAPDSRIEAGHFWLAFAPGCCLVTFRHAGNLQSGGEFENEYILLGLRHGGRTTRMEFFEIDAVDAALARFEELRAEIARE